MNLVEQMMAMVQEEIPDRNQFVRSLQRIEHTVNRIAKIITGLRSFSRDGSNDKHREVGFLKVVEETLSFCYDHITKNDVRLEVIVPDHEIPVFCNSTELSQVIVNLLSNAHDAVQDQDEKHIILEIRDLPTSVEISVTDSGVKISKETADRMFTPFFTTKAVGKGTGLGLSISSTIIKNHRGSLYLDRNVSKTRLVMTIPKLQEQMLSAA